MRCRPHGDVPEAGGRTLPTWSGPVKPIRARFPPVDAAPFENRLKKMLRERQRFAAREGTDAFRVYDGDIPEFGYVVESYAGRPHVVEYERRGSVGRASATERREAVIAAVARTFGVPPSSVPLKVRAPKVWGEEQYEKREAAGRRFAVHEGGVELLVDLEGYLDTGLFLDHRTTRLRVQAEARGKRFLNLFCYTGAFTVHAAKGGATSSVSVDLSNTYLAWAADNLSQNGLLTPAHELVRSDVTRWVEQAEGTIEPFDLAVLDPPSFSASKKMEGTFDVQRDHPALLGATLRLLRAPFVLYFSTNFTGFVLDERPLRGLRVEETTPTSIPQDFRHRQIHRCFRIASL